MFVLLSPRGPSAYTLSVAGKSIGWLRERRMHVGGFATADHALAAGDAGFVALSRWVARRRGEIFAEPPPIHVAAMDAGSFEWLGVDGTCVARLVSRSDVGGFGVELTLPQGLLMAVAVGAAAQICDAMLAVAPDPTMTSDASPKPPADQATLAPPPASLPAP